MPQFSHKPLETGVVQDAKVLGDVVQKHPAVARINAAQYPEFPGESLSVITRYLTDVALACTNAGSAYDQETGEHTWVITIDVPKMKAELESNLAGRVQRVNDYYQNFLSPYMSFYDLMLAELAMPQVSLPTLPALMNPEYASNVPQAYKGLNETCLALAEKTMAACQDTQAIMRQHDAVLDTSIAAATLQHLSYESESKDKEIKMAEVQKRMQELGELLSALHADLQVIDSKIVSAKSSDQNTRSKLASEKTSTESKIARCEAGIERLKVEAKSVVPLVKEDFQMPADNDDKGAEFSAQDLPGGVVKLTLSSQNIAHHSKALAQGLTEEYRKAFSSIYGKQAQSNIIYLNHLIELENKLNKAAQAVEGLVNYKDKVLEEAFLAHSKLSVILGHLLSNGLFLNEEKSQLRIFDQLGDALEGGYQKWLTCSEPEFDLDMRLLGADPVSIKIVQQLKLHRALLQKVNIMGGKLAGECIETILADVDNASKQKSFSKDDYLKLGTHLSNFMKMNANLIEYRDDIDPAKKQAFLVNLTKLTQALTALEAKMGDPSNERARDEDKIAAYQRLKKMISEVKEQLSAKSDTLKETTKRQAELQQKEDNAYQQSISELDSLKRTKFDKPNGGVVTISPQPRHDVMPALTAGLALMSERPDTLVLINNVDAKEQVRLKKLLSFFDKKSEENEYDTAISTYIKVKSERMALHQKVESLAKEFLAGKKSYSDLENELKSMCPSSATQDYRDQLMALLVEKMLVTHNISQILDVITLRSKSSSPSSVVTSGVDEASVAVNQEATLSRVIFPAMKQNDFIKVKYLEHINIQSTHDVNAVINLAKDLMEKKNNDGSESVLASQVRIVLLSKITQFINEKKVPANYLDPGQPLRMLLNLLKIQDTQALQSAFNKVLNPEVKAKLYAIHGMQRALVYSAFEQNDKGLIVQCMNGGHLQAVLNADDGEHAIQTIFNQLPVGRQAAFAESTLDVMASMAAAYRADAVENTTEKKNGLLATMAFLLTHHDNLPNSDNARYCAAFARVLFQSICNSPDASTEVKVGALRAFMKILVLLDKEQRNQFSEALNAHNIKPFANLNLHNLVRGAVAADLRDDMLTLVALLTAPPSNDQHAMASKQNINLAHDLLNAIQETIHYDEADVHQFIDRQRNMLISSTTGVSIEDLQTKTEILYDHTFKFKNRNIDLEMLIRKMIESADKTTEERVSTQVAIIGTDENKHYIQQYDKIKHWIDMLDCALDATDSSGSSTGVSRVEQARKEFNVLKGEDPYKKYKNSARAMAGITIDHKYNNLKNSLDFDYIRQHRVQFNNLRTELIGKRDAIRREYKAVDAIVSKREQTKTVAQSALFSNLFGQQQPTSSETAKTSSPLKKLFSSPFGKNK